jgi:hypothetical protein
MNGQSAHKAESTKSEQIRTGQHMSNWKTNGGKSQGVSKSLGMDQTERTDRELVTKCEATSLTPRILVGQRETVMRRSQTQPFSPQVHWNLELAMKQLAL